jgi:Kef-type K+ transport system membrane component KefB
MISHASIVIPFALGIGFMYYVQSVCARGSCFVVQFVHGMLYITAFPVLARIVQERGIHKFKLEHYGR